MPALALSQQVMGIAGVDTRAITRRLRVTGCLNGAITTDPSISGARLGRQQMGITCLPKTWLDSKLESCRHPMRGVVHSCIAWSVAAGASSVPSQPTPAACHRAAAASLCPADEELLQRCKSWTIVGKDLIKEVRLCLD